MFTNKQIMLFILIWTSTHYAMENNSMTPIKTWDDAKQFAGQVVAYKTDAYDPFGYVSNPDEFKYLYVHKTLSTWSIDGFGFGTTQLVKKGESYFTTPLTNGILAESNYKMRHISPSEKQVIMHALKNKIAKFDGTDSDPEDDSPVSIVLSLID